ncbi:MAG: nucleotide-binding universal stress UspA family protein [Cognaticolwellia sp.]
MKRQVQESFDRTTPYQHYPARGQAPRYASLVKKHRDSGVDISIELLWGNAVVVILEKVKDLHVNMLFIGRQGRSRVVDILLGSVANKLTHRVGIPIVLVP